MSVVDFELTKYVSDSHKVAERLVHEAEGLLDEDAKAAGIRAVEAWMVLNAAAVVATRIEARKALVSIRQTRNKILAMGAALRRSGIILQDAPETTMAFLITPRET